ncbi:unnamed protein product, partial [Laminaria digitata]
ATFTFICYVRHEPIMTARALPRNWKEDTRFDGPEHWGMDARWKELFPGRHSPGNFVPVNVNSDAMQPETMVFDGSSSSSSNDEDLDVVFNNHDNNDDDCDFESPSTHNNKKSTTTTTTTTTSAIRNARVAEPGAGMGAGQVTGKGRQRSEAPRRARGWREGAGAGPSLSSWPRRKQPRTFPTATASSSEEEEEEFDDTEAEIVGREPDAGSRLSPKGRRGVGDGGRGGCATSPLACQGSDSSCSPRGRQGGGGGRAAASASAGVEEEIESSQSHDKFSDSDSDKNISGGGGKGFTGSKNSSSRSRSLAKGRHSGGGGKTLEKGGVRREGGRRRPPSSSSSSSLSSGWISVQTTPGSAGARRGGDAGAAGGGKRAAQRGGKRLRKAIPAEANEQGWIATGRSGGGGGGSSGGGGGSGGGGRNPISAFKAPQSSTQRNRERSMTQKTINFPLLVDD